jgi:hypothetical protein
MGRVTHPLAPLSPHLSSVLYYLIIFIDIAAASVSPGGVFKWPTQMGGIVHAIWVNQVGYLGGPLQSVRFWVQYWLIGWGN